VFPHTQILNSEKMHGIEMGYIMTLFVVCNISVKYVELQQRIYKISFRIATEECVISGFRSGVNLLFGLRSVYWWLLTDVSEQRPKTILL